MSKRKRVINGQKVIYRYPFAGFLSGLLCLAIVAIPTLIYFMFPVLTIKFGSTSIDIKGLDLIQGTMLYYKNDAMRPEILDFFHFMDDHSTQFGGLIEQFFPLFFLVTGVLYAFMILWAFISLIYAIAFILFGKVRKYKGAYKNSWGFFIWTLLLTGIFYALGFFIKLAGQLEGVEIICYANYGIIFAGSAFMCMLILGIIYVAAFKHRIYYKKAELMDEEDNESPLKKTEVNENKNPQNELPANLKAIGGHSFAENTQIQIANIPYGIKVIGEGAFANALNLEFVSIPRTVKSIKYNAFFNCKKLTRINYGGTKEQWRHVKRGSNWLAKAGTSTVVCKDGAIVVNPY